MEIRHDATNQCFRTANGAVLEYTMKDGLHYFDHTEVPPELRGQGVAGQLAKAAFDHAVENGWKVVPACSYIEVYLRRHPEYSGIIAG